MTEKAKEKAVQSKSIIELTLSADGEIDEKERMYIARSGLDFKTCREVELHLIEVCCSNAINKAKSWEAMKPLKAVDMLVDKAKEDDEITKLSITQKDVDAIKKEFFAIEIRPPFWTKNAWEMVEQICG